MKVAFFSDSKINSGGSSHVTFPAAKILNKLNIEGIDVDFVVTQKSVYKELTSKYHEKIIEDLLLAFISNFYEITQF